MSSPAERLRPGPDTHLVAETCAPHVRHQLLIRMRDELDRGAGDPELLYLGARYAASLGMKDEARRLLDHLENLFGGPVAPTVALRKAVDAAEPELPRDALQRAWAPVEEAARKASAAYDANDLASARLALENLLLLDAEQANVLWNLLVVTTEQQDVPAYERYWQRYATLQLGRMLRREPGAREELVRFYVRAAVATDRVFDEGSVKVHERLRTPGLLPRWLEAHAALAWLDQPRRPLMKFWLHAFYPELERWMEDGAPAVQPGPGMARSKLPFDPALKLLRRFAQWSREQFGLEREEDAHGRTVVALANCAARIRWQPYVPKLAEALRGSDADFRPFRRTMQEACSLPLELRLRDLLGAEDWRGIERSFGDPDLGRSLTPMLRLFVALALCRTSREQQALELALATLPDMTAEDLASDAQPAALWQNVLQANLHAAFSTPGKPDEARLKATRKSLQQVPHAAHHREFLASRLVDVDEALQKVEQQKELEAAIAASREDVANGNFKAARARIEKLPDKPGLQEIKKSILAQIAEAENDSKLKKRVDAAIEEAKELVAAGKFVEARRTVRDLPDVAELKGLKTQFLSQIDEVASHAATQKQVEKAIADAKELVAAGKFDQARRAIRDLPNAAELKELKTRFLSQIDEAASHAATQQRVEKAIADAKELVGKGKFDQARRAILDLPDVADLKQLKAQFLSQIEDAKRDAAVHHKVDKAVEDAKRHVAAGRFRDARRAVDALPDQPDDLRALKRNFRSQIDEAESAWKRFEDENSTLRRNLSRRGVTSEAIANIAGLNDLDLSNPAAVNALLKAIERELG